MKALIIVVIAFQCMFFSCEKKGHGPTVRGKLVYRSCATAVVQVLDSTSSPITVTNWQMSPSSPTYNNVFRVENHCTFGKENISVGQEFDFQLTNTGDASCIVCMLWDNPPTVSHKIVVK
jgi:hypothetical protein